VFCHRRAAKETARRIVRGRYWRFEGGTWKEVSSRKCTKSQSSGERCAKRGQYNVFYLCSVSGCVIWYIFVAYVYYVKAAHKLCTMEQLWTRACFSLIWVYPLLTPLCCTCEIIFLLLHRDRGVPEYCDKHVSLGRYLHWMRVHLD